MRLQDIVNEDDKQLNEFLPALAAGAARVGSAAVGTLAKGAQAVGTAVGKGAMQAAIGSAMPATSNDPKVQGAIMAQQQKQRLEQRKAIQDQITAVTKQLNDLRRQLTQL
jgi:hypothetical protein